jgi:aerobic C4-dicarboxylate transport protein
VATIVVAKWTGDLDTGRLQRTLNNETEVEASEPEVVLDAVDTHLPVAR